ncbi:putative gtp-binding nuclear protein gsp1 ran protein [Botrytis fragariae]|uniref:Putative gtp-binding nuclear protein gsp1 ran protein n=1 Tax=Botrytis fragariae TaxID=1964551 RepID=A0A8H6ECT3_9HELO|nr:putative gtp-binding nuclear protein gsp1 ran protein [Botrytis fragariae]KAF5867674.1 putative gtp-binding nuclear protein gsp1 ran protein [Botrytis fragariae]
MKYIHQGVLLLLRIYYTDYIRRKTGLYHPDRLSQQAIMTYLDSRIISTRSGDLEKLVASILKPEDHNIEEETLALQAKRYRSVYFHKKLLKVYHKEMGNAAATPLPDVNDKNCTTEQH